jgi:hypothetical protein
MDRVYRAGLSAQFYTTCKIVAASLDDRPCPRERREGVSVRALVAQSTIEPKAGETNLPTNHFGSDIAAASGRISVVSLGSFRVYRRFLRSLRSDQGRGEVDGSSCGADEVHLRGCRIHARATRVSAMPRKVGPSAPRVAAVSIRVLDFRRRNTGSG